MKYLLWMLSFIILSAPKAYSAKLLIARFQSWEMDTVKSVIEQDLAEHEIYDFIMTKDTKFESFLEVLKEQQPDVVALLDNKAVNFMKRFYELNDEKQSNLPAAATMSLNLRHVLKDNPQICGIAYEVPAFTIVTRFRAISGLPIRNVLFPYRKSEFETSYQEAKKQLKREGINLIGVNLEEAGTSSQAINRAANRFLRLRVKGKDIDAIIVPTDNIILNKEGFLTVWLKKAKELRLPFLCNIENFVSRDFDFCTFAAYPNFKELGHQFAEQLHEIIEGGAIPQELGIDYIVSVREALDLVKSKRLGISFSEEKLEGIQLVK